jgi:primosomal protein N' (replication factor Y)
MACTQNYPTFFEQELKFRRAMQYPPLTALINVLVRAPTIAAALDDAEVVARALREGRSARALTVLGPAPAALGRLRGEYRAQILVKGSNRRQMREAVLTAVGGRSEAARRITVDVDPVTVL